MASKDSNGETQVRTSFNIEATTDAADYTVSRGVENAISPEAYDLHRQWYKNWLGNLQGKTLLDVGCGTGEIIKLLDWQTAGWQYWGLDISEGMLGRAKQWQHNQAQPGQFRFIQGSLLNLPYPDHYVERIICISVVQYLNEVMLDQSLREIRRVLKKNGHLVLHFKNSVSIYIFNWQMLIPTFLKQIWRRLKPANYQASGGPYIYRSPQEMRRKIERLGGVILAEQAFSLWRPQTSPAMISKISRWQAKLYQSRWQKIANLLGPISLEYYFVVRFKAMDNSNESLPG